MTKPGRVIAAILAILAGTVASGAKPAQKVTTKVAVKRPAHAPRYRVTDLGVSVTDYGQKSIVLNNRGDAVVTTIYGTDGPRDRSYVWRDGRRTVLTEQPDYPQMTICRIDDQSVVVGSVYKVYDGGMIFMKGVGTVWAHGGIVRQFASEPRLSVTCVEGIDAKVRIVYTRSPGGPMEAKDTPNLWHTYVWDKGQTSDLGIANALSMNETGEILAERSDSEYAQTTHPSVYVQGAWRDLPKLAGYEWMRAAGGLNNACDVAGYAWNGNTPDHPEAFLYRGGKMIDIGPGMPSGINDSGEIIGSFDRNPSVWRDGRWYSLNQCLPAKSGWALEEVDAVNNRGQIGGFAKKGGRETAVLLTPR
jgi:probable HAF family extracellular repeat protein